MSIARKIATLTFTLGTAMPAFPAVMYVHDAGGNLAKVDTATGVASIIGNMGIQMTDIAFDPSGNLYGLDFDSLFSIDKTTGGVTHIGAHGIAVGNALVFGDDGTLYGAGGASKQLYALDVSTGVGTSLGTIGIFSSGDLAFVGSDLYLAAGISNLVKIDLANLANTTTIGFFGRSGVFGLASASDGKLYGVAGTSIFEVDTLSGFASNAVSFGGQGLGTAYGLSYYAQSGALPEPSPIPVPAAGFLMLCGLAMLGMARRRGRAVSRN